MSKTNAETELISTSPVDPVRSDTAVLFGAYCHEERLSNMISDEGAFSQVARVPEWYQALERGEFIPTTASAREIDGAFRDETRRTLYRTLIELENEPFGMRANSLRERFRLPGYSPSPGALENEIGIGLSPIATSIRERDRLLVTGPLALFAVVASLQTALYLWANGRISDLALPVAATIGGLSIAVIAMALPNIERAFAWVVPKVRDPQRKETFHTCAKFRNTAGIRQTHAGCWFQEGEAVHLLPNCRSAAVRDSQQCDYFERATVVLSINLVAAMLVLVLSGVDGRALVNLVSLAMIAGFVGIGLRAAKAAVDSYEDALSVGLGLVSSASDSSEA